MEDSESLSEMAARHSAGATHTHNSPFNGIEVFRNDFELTQDFIDKYAKPFYMRLGQDFSNEFANHIDETKPLFTEEVVRILLSDFNWRTRKVGAYFAFINRQTQLIDEIGKHLLRSEVCCVGDDYCHVLACFYTTASLDYIHRYLSYYLRHPELDFDQAAAVATLSYLDEINGTKELAKHKEDIEFFIARVTSMRTTEPYINTEHLKNKTKARIEFLRNLPKV